MTPSLFDNPDPATLPDAAPSRRSRMARATDPVTSHQAAAQAVESGTVAKHRAAILEAMRGQAWMTSEEIAHRAGIDRVAAARRMKELEDDYLIVRGPVKKSAGSKRPGVTWRLL